MIDAWKNREVFEKQLELNLRQLKEGNVTHWIHFEKCMDIVKPNSILDIGHGSGVYSQLCRDIEYIGIDYAQEAVDVATEAWGLHCFHKMDLFELEKEFTDEFDVLHAGACIDIMPNGNEALEFLLNLNHRAIILGRVKITTEPNHFREYTAYGLIQTGMFYHNDKQFFSTIRDHGYEYKKFGDTYLLRKE